MVVPWLASVKPCLTLSSKNFRKHPKNSARLTVQYYQTSSSDAPAPDPVEAKKSFSKSLYKVVRVPIGFLRSFLCSLSGSLNISEQTLREFESVDKKVLIKLLQLACGVEPSWPFGPYEQDKWTELYTARHARFGQKIMPLEWDDYNNIDWEACGHYRLAPPFSSAQDKDISNHTFERLECGKFRIALDKIPIKGSWAISSNWSLAEATLESVTGPGRFLCRGFFEGLDGWSEYVQVVEAEGDKKKKKPKNEPIRTPEKVPMPSLPASSSRRHTSEQAQVQHVVEPPPTPAEAETALAGALAKLGKEPCA